MKIVLSVVLGFFLIGCSSDDGKKDTQHKVVSKSVKEVKEVAKPKEPAKPIAKEVKKVVEPKVEKVHKKVEKIVKVVEPEVKEVEKKVEVAPKEVKKETKVSFKSGKEIFSACGGCHGMDGSKSALGKSKIIKGWDSQKVTDALDGYRAGTYGGSMKGLMKGQVLKLSETEVKAVSEYISGL